MEIDDNDAMMSKINENAEKAKIRNEQERVYRANIEARKIAQEKAKKMEHRRKVKALITTGLVVGGIAIGAASYKHGTNIADAKGTNTVITQVANIANGENPEELIARIKEVNKKLSQQEYEKNPKENFEKITDEHLDAIKKVIAKKSGIEDYSNITINPNEQGEMIVHYNDQIITKTQDIKDLLSILDKEQTESIYGNNPSYEDYTSAYNNTIKTIMDEQDER